MVHIEVSSPQEGTIMGVAARKHVQVASAVPKVITHLHWGEKGAGETALILWH